MKMKKILPQKTDNSNKVPASSGENEIMSDYGISKINLTKRNLFSMEFSPYKTKDEFIESKENKPFVKIVSNIQLEPPINTTNNCTDFSKN